MVRVTRQSQDHPRSDPTECCLTGAMLRDLGSVCYIKSVIHIKFNQLIRCKQLGQKAGQPPYLNTIITNTATYSSTVLIISNLGDQSLHLKLK